MANSRKNPRYIDQIDDVVARDVDTLRVKDKEYGGSWQRRGGTGAFMMAARKFDRLEESVKKHGYDIFRAIEQDTRAEGVLDDIRDLRAYLTLIEAEMVARGVVKLEES